MSSDQTLTPTSVKSNQLQVPSTVPTHSMDDINMLLYLDALKRSVDNQKVIAQTIEEAYKTYQKRYYEYANMYCRYVALVKKSCTRKLLQQCRLPELKLDTAAADVKCIKDKLSNDVVTDNINAAELEKFKNGLCRAEKFDNLKDLRSELMQLKKVTESVQSSIESIEAGIDNGTNLALDLSVQELFMTNFPKLSNRNETIN